MSMKLRDLIRKVRACKTAAEERAVIAKESAMIRTAIREEQAHFRHRNVAKLLFMHMLGYPTHFGQLECMKLVASPHFPEKRIGYLGMMLLLSEQADVLMLSTNALKNDLNSENKFVVGLALCAIGNLATADMSRDLAPEVDKHLKSNLPYLRKKACLAMARCLAKCPDMVEDFVERVVTLLKDKSHGVLNTVVQLMTQVVMVDYRYAVEEGEDPLETECRKSFLRLVPTLVKLLRNLLGTGFAPEHDVGGISDPFLQVQLLTLLRLLGVNNQEACDEMNDVLAQVATNTETAKNAGNAILYECVQTIMGTDSEDGLRVLAVNILGRFLLNRDNNIRYVALNTLSRCIVEQKHEGNVAIVTAEENANNAMSALQRHRTVIIDCLKDPDISIRQRALELIYHLVNADNVRSLTAELLNYLVLCPREHKADICTRILKVVDRFSPDDKWRVDTLITTLTIAGRESSRDVQNAAVVYISRAAPDTQAFATHKLLKAIRDDDGHQHGLLSVGIWCIGEYGDLLLKPCTYTADSTDDGDLTSNSSVPITLMALEPLAVVKTVEDVTERLGCPEEVKQRALTTYAKLTQRFASTGDVSVVNRLQELLKKHSTDRALELQLRSCEFNALVSAARGMAPPVNATGGDIFGVGDNGGAAISANAASAAKEAMARMPIVDMKLLQKRLSTYEMEEGDVPVRAPRAAAVASVKKNGDLLDLEDIFGGAPTSAAPVANGSIGAAPAASSDAGKSDLDLLADIFSAQAPAASVPAAASGGYDPFNAPLSQPSPPVAAVTNPLDLFTAPTVSVAASAPSAGIDIFGAPSPGQASSSSNVADLFGATPISAPTPTGPRISAFSFNGLSAEFECSKPDPMNLQKSLLVVHFRNTAGDLIHGLNLQVAVPKFVKMEMEPPSSTTVPLSGGNAPEVTQKIAVTNSMLGSKNLVLKLKVSFTFKGQKMEHMSTASGFPTGQY